MSELAARHLVRAGARATVLGGRTLRQGRAARGGARRPRRALRVPARGAGAGRHRDQRHRRARHRDPPRGRRGGAGRAARPAALPDRHRGAARRRPRTPRSVLGVFLYDLDDLKTVAEANLRERRKEASAAEAILERGGARVPRVAALARGRAAAGRAAPARRRDPHAPRSRRRASAWGTLTPGAGEAPRGRDHRHREQAPARAHRPPQGDGRQRPAAEHVGLIRKLFGL